MTKEQVIAFRENAKKNNKQLYVFLDNCLYFYENLRDAEVFIWDDSNEVVHVIGGIRNGDCFYIKSQTPYELYTFGYDVIQGMGVYLSYSDMIKELDNFKKQGLITSDKYTESIKKLAPLSKTNTNPNTRTMKTYSDKDYKEYQDSKRRD